ncbi:hypothetical protein D3C86_1021520 [compost metagenome]
MSDGPFIEKAAATSNSILKAIQEYTALAFSESSVKSFFIKLLMVSKFWTLDGYFFTISSTSKKSFEKEFEIQKNTKRVIIFFKA